MKNMEGPSNDGKESRRGFLKKLGILGAGLVLAPEKVFSNSNTENNESNRIIKSSEMIEMEDGGNLPDGFKRTKINIEFNDERGKIEEQEVCLCLIMIKAKPNLFRRNLIHIFSQVELILIN